MRAEEYTRELVGAGYEIVSVQGDFSENDYYSYGAPIEMSMMYLHDNSQYPLFDNLEELIKAASVEYADDEPGFEQIYPDIMRGNRPDWQLSEVQVFPDGIALTYSNDQRDIGRVIISGIELGLTFKTSRTRLGFDPTYKVHISHDPCGTFTKVYEDLGYMRRIIFLELKENADPRKACLGENQTAHIFEYVGM